MSSGLLPERSALRFKAPLLMGPHPGRFIGEATAEAIESGLRESPANNYLRVSKGIPEDAYVEGAFWDPSRRTLMIAFRSPTGLQAEPGSVSPHIKPEFSVIYVGMDFAK